MTLFSVLADLFLGLTVAVLGFSLPFFILFRDDPIFRQRSYPLEFLWWINNLAQVVRMRFIIISIETKHPWVCLGTIWNSGIQTPAWAFAGLIRCIRLFLLYSIAKEKFRLENKQGLLEDARSENSRPSRWWLNPKYLHWKYMYALYFMMLAVFQIFPLATTIAGLTFHDGIIPVSFCKTPAGRSGSIGAICCLAIIILFLGYKMRHVHDAYFLKKELNLLAFETVFVAAPALTSTFFTPWGWIPSEATMFVFSTTSFLIPVLLVLKRKAKDITTRGSSSEFSEETSTSRTSKVADKINGFHEHPKIQKLLSDPASLPWIQEYLIHYQDFELSNQLLCWSSIIKFREAGNSGVAGRAYLLYKKFLENDSYIKVAGISEEARNNLATILSAEIQKESTEVTVDVFNDILSELEESLAERLFKNFFKSEFFVRHREELALRIGIDV